MRHVPIHPPFVFDEFEFVQVAPIHSLELTVPPLCVRRFDFILIVLSASHARFRAR